MSAVTTLEIYEYVCKRKPIVKTTATNSDIAHQFNQRNTENTAFHFLLGSSNTVNKN